MLARVSFAKNFRAFSEAGRKLGDLHVNYDNVEPMDRLKITEKITLFPAQNSKEAEEYYRVKKIKIIKASKEKYIQYNEHINIQNIPSEAWDYIGGVVIRY